MKLLKKKNMFRHFSCVHEPLLLNFKKQQPLFKCHFKKQSFNDRAGLAHLDRLACGGQVYPLVI